MDCRLPRANRGLLSEVTQRCNTLGGVSFSAKGLGRVITPSGMMARADGHRFGTEPLPHALIAASSGLTPMIFITRVRL